MLKANDVFCSMCGKWLRAPTADDKKLGPENPHFCEFDCAQLFYANLELISDTARSKRRQAMRGMMVCLNQ